MVQIFITGATGYIGGDVLHELYTAHPEYEYTALVRTKEKGNSVTSKYPKVKTILGDNDSSELLKQESSKADVVIHTADSSDHEGAAKAIAEGLIAGHSREKPGYWLHTGGTGILTYFDSSAGKLGQESGKVFNDLDGVEELVNLPSEAFHRNVDEIVLDTGAKFGDRVKTAIVCPPTIYGKGRGPSLTRGRQVYELTKTTLELGKGPIIGEGKARWNNIHIHDLSRAYILLISAALSPTSVSPELWCQKGYFFTENGEHYWGELSKSIAETAKSKGFIDDAGTEMMDEETAKRTAGFEALSWGWNSRGKAARLEKYLGWKPREGSLWEEIPDIVDQEWARLREEK